MLKPLALSVALLALAAGNAREANATPRSSLPSVAPEEDTRLARKSRKQLAEEAEAARLAEEAETQRLADEDAKRRAEEELKARLAAEEQERQAQADEAAKRAAAEETSAVEATGLEARARRLTDELARAIKRLPGDHRDQSFAVVPFSENDEESKSRRLGLVVSDMVLTNLARDHRVNLVERGRVSSILDEQAFQASGAVDPEKAVQVGELLGARGLIVGEVSDLGDGFRISARVLDMESAAVLATAETTLPKEELIAFSADAVVLRSKGGAFFRSVVAPGWGQLYNREPVKAAIVAGGVGALALSTGIVGATAWLTHDRYDGSFSRYDLPADLPDTPQQRSKYVVGLRESANLQYTVAGVLLGLTATAWLLGALDAYLSGVDVETLDDALATN